jgi:transcriptional regulator
MYIPQAHEETDIDVLHALIRSHPLGTWVAQSNTELVANHLPFIIDTTRGEFGTLMCHVARANPVWQTHSRTMNSIVTFKGPQSYITPSWYPSKHAHGKAVPTWNYAVVHAQGLPQVIEDREWLLTHVAELTDTHESTQALPWKVSDAPPEYIDKLLAAIVGIEIPIARLIGKWKASQNRSTADKLGVIAGLTARGDPQSQDMAALVSRFVSMNEPRDR